MTKNNKIFDCFIFFNELDILDIRLNTLDQEVDYFVLVESTRTFTGQPKELVYQQNKERFARFHDKIIHVIDDEMPAQVDSTYVREAHQRSAIGQGLGTAQPDDLIIVSDVDEIPKPELLRKARETASGRITYFEGVYYHFYLNWRLADRKDLMTSRMIEFKNYRDGWLVRSTKGRRSTSMPLWVEYIMWLPYAAYRHRAFLQRQVCRNGCWHFSFMMSPDDVRRKLSAYKTPDRLEATNSRAEVVEERISQRRSMFDGEIVLAPMTELPDYVQKHPGKFKHMIDREDLPA